MDKIVITTVLGDSREVTRYYDNGFDCPYCGYAVQYPTIICTNPACESARRWKPDELVRWRAEMVAEKEIKNQNERSRQWLKKDHQERAEAHTKWTREQIDFARKTGACLKCLF